MDVQDIYRGKIETYKADESGLKKRSQVYLYIKLLSFCGFACGVYVLCTGENTVSWCAVLLLAVIYVAAYMLDLKCMGRIRLCRSKQRVCNNELKYLDGDFTAFDAGNKYIDAGHEYSYDLDVFGDASLFNRINRTITYKGSDMLAGKFTRLCCDRNEIMASQDAVSELSGMTDWRIKFLTNGHVESNIEQLSELIKEEAYSKWATHSVLPYVSVALTLTALVLGIAGFVSMSIFSLLFSAQLVITFLVSKSLQKAGARIGGLHREYTGYSAILRDIGQTGFKSELLSALQTRLTDGDVSCMASFRQLSRILNLFDQRSNVIVYILLNGLVMYDVILIRRFVAWGEKYLSRIGEWTDCIAEIDALVSLATYAFNNPRNTMPVVIDGDEDDCVIDAVDVYHPFLSADKAVPNSFVLNRKNISIITGANMAGKSTFLRTVGITYVLACCGVPVCAGAFRFSIVTLFSSMRTTDNLSKDISYFNAELLRLKQLINHVKYSRFTLIILDEILKGTNSKDKLEGSVLFLNEISRHNVSAIIATHDLELANLEKKNSDVYKNYCFEIELSENITYSYKIRRGVARNLNASYLLRKILNNGL